MVVSGKITIMVAAELPGVGYEPQGSGSWLASHVVIMVVLVEYHAVLYETAREFDPRGCGFESR